MFKRLRGALLQQGLRTAVRIGRDAATSATSKTFNQRFDLKSAASIFIHGTQTDVTVRYGEPGVVGLNAELRAAFGLDIVTEQDEAGIYIVIRRKPVVGAMSRAIINIVMPRSVRLICQLTPGNVRLFGTDGKVVITPESYVAPKVKRTRKPTTATRP